MGLGVCSSCIQQCQCDCTESNEGEGGNVDGHTDEVVPFWYFSYFIDLLVIFSWHRDGLLHKKGIFWYIMVLRDTPTPLSSQIKKKGCCWCDHPTACGLHLLSPPSCLASHAQLQWGDSTLLMRHLSLISISYQINQQHTAYRNKLASSKLR